MRITNHSVGPISLGGEAVLAPRSTTTVPDPIWDRYKNSVVVKAFLDDRTLSDEKVEIDPVDEDQSEMDDRMKAIAEIMKDVTDDDDLTADGKPKTDAINRLLPDDFEDVSAMERDRVLELMADGT